MCGIAGFLARDSAGFSESVLTLMTRRLAHRGPDGQGSWMDAQIGVGLGHRRLSIIDLSAAGDQPMVSGSGRYVIVYNGEIYNYRRLRDELASLRHQFRGQSDTEVFLSAVEQWGVTGAVGRLNGIFAFALWDTRDKTLHLGRDHLGVKPLYVGRVGRALIFASELKALTVCPGFDATIDRDALALLTRHNCIPAPHSIYRSVRKLLPGTVATYRATSEDVTVSTYWTVRQAAVQGVQNRLSLPDSEVVDQLDQLLRDAVSMQMISDVPLGAFLSGGIDSSTVVALMQAQSVRPVRTFSIGSDVTRYDEAPFARAVAKHLGTEHTELYVSAADALATIPGLPQIYDEPFSDSSQIPTLLVSRLARRSVTVSARWPTE